MKRAVVIGGGLGGLSAAIRLAHGGMNVTLLEKQPTLGGKLQRVEVGDYRFDRGPSTITMLPAFQRVFAAAGERMEDVLTFRRLSPLTRNHFPDGTVVDLVADAEAMAEQINRYSASDARQLKPFLAEARRLHAIAQERFLNRLLTDFSDKLNPSLLAGFFQVRPFTRLQTLLRRYFTHPYTQALFGRYATYVGSSPYEAPAIFAMLAHTEAQEGIYSVEGGTYAIVEAFAALARRLGVTIHTDAKAHRIHIHQGRVSGVESAAGTFPADVVILNGDALSVYARLVPEAHRPSLPDRKIERYEPSLSGYVILAGLPSRNDDWVHHNVYFPDIYKQEFTDIFHHRQPPGDPTIYVCFSGHTESGMAPPGGSNLFILTNAPALSDRFDWDQEGAAVRQRILRLLERWGFPNLEQEADVLMHYTPADLQRDTDTHRGSIYGISSNSFSQTFFRPGNRSRDIRGLWFTGGTTHPGGGTPIVVTSGQLVAERILQEMR